MFQSFEQFLNSSFTTSFFGAIAGSFSVLFIGWLSDQRKMLAEFNAWRGMLSLIIDNLLVMKRQHVVPVVTNYQANLRIKEGKKERPGFYLIKFECPELYLNVPIERLFTVTDRHPEILKRMLSVKRSCVEVHRANTNWNSVVVEIMAMPQEERSNFYFGGDNQGINNTYFSDVVYNYEKEVDHALAFTYEALNAFEEVAKKRLPFWLRKRIVKFEIDRDFLVFYSQMNSVATFDKQKVK